MAEPSDRVGLRQPAGMSPEARSVIAADDAIGDPGRGPEHVKLAIDAAVTDYRRAFARRLIEAGVSFQLVWSVMGALPIDRRLPAELVAPLSPESDR